MGKTTMATEAHKNMSEETKKKVRLKGEIRVSIGQALFRKDLTPKQVAEQYGVSEPTAYKILADYRKSHKTGQHLPVKVEEISQEESDALKEIERLQSRISFLEEEINTLQKLHMAVGRTL